MLVCEGCMKGCLRNLGCFWTHHGRLTGQQTCPLFLLVLSVSAWSIVISIGSRWSRAPRGVAWCNHSTLHWLLGSRGELRDANGSWWQRYLLLLLLPWKLWQLCFDLDRGCWRSEGRWCSSTGCRGLKH
jgi:hypothetical protein